jgi:chemotaxis protein CheC
LQAEKVHSLVEVSDALRTVVVNSAYNASRALSKWLKRGVRLRCDGFETVHISRLAGAGFSPDDVVIGVHLPLMGDLSGDVLMLFPEQVAFRLVDLLIGLPLGTTKTLDDLESSALQETGNIVGSSFANSLAMWLKLSTIPHAPVVALDLASAVIDPILVSQASVSDEALLSKTEFEIDGHRMEWVLFVLPSPAALEIIRRKCEGDQIQERALLTIAINGAFAASRAMSKWLKHGVRLTTEGFSRVALNEITGTVDNDEPVVALHLHLADELQGHALLTIPHSTALRFVEILMGMPEGAVTELDEMAESCLQETGNIVSGAFVNSWAKWLDLRSAPRPPQLQVDLLPAVLDSVLVEQAAESDEAFMAKATFSINDRWLDWNFYLLPHPSSMRLIEAAME